MLYILLCIISCYVKIIMEVGQCVSLSFVELCRIVTAIFAARFLFFQRDWDPRKMKRKRLKEALFKEWSVRVTNYPAIYLRESLSYVELDKLIYIHLA